MLLFQLKVLYNNDIFYQERQWSCSGVCNFKQILHIVLVIPLLTLNKSMQTRKFTLLKIIFDFLKKPHVIRKKNSNCS